MIAPPTNSQYPTSGRRLAFAKFITSEDNPLTARVMVNRLWYQHFGQGIVSTPNNFGKMGTLPSNPELLDWLATEFVQKGWSIKQMQREDHEHRRPTRWLRRSMTPTAWPKDPTDQFMWRFPVKRMEAEIIRDAVLSASGDLNRANGRSILLSANTEEHR